MNGPSALRASKTSAVRHITRFRCQSSRRYPTDTVTIVAPSFHTHSCTLPGVVCCDPAAERFRQNLLGTALSCWCEPPCGLAPGDATPQGAQEVWPRDCSSARAARGTGIVGRLRGHPWPEEASQRPFTIHRSPPHKDAHGAARRLCPFSVAVHMPCFVRDTQQVQSDWFLRSKVQSSVTWYLFCI